MKHLVKFSIEHYLSSINKGKVEPSHSRFDEVCQIVKRTLDEEWDRMVSDSEKATRLDHEKGAIIGKDSDVMFFKDKISQILASKKLLSEGYPTYYPSLTEGIFASLYGLDCIAPWAYDWTEEFKASSSAKILGDRVYFLINGNMVLQPFRISKKRRQQLRQALLLAHPQERTEKGYNEVFLENGTRVTMFSDKFCKDEEDTIVFRKYVLKDLSFEILAGYGTFPKEAIPLFEAMIEIGFNVVFVGQMRSGKTTFLQTWMHYMDQSLEGVALATDPETHWKSILPDAPLMELVADKEELEKISKPIRRSDADYIILEEMRDASAYNMFTDIISLGTMHSAGTIHDRNPLNVPKKMADSICNEYGGDRDSIIASLYENVNYVFELYQVPENKSRKRLKSITEFRYDPAADKVSAHKICLYDAKSDSWKWRYDIGADKENLAMGYESALARFKETLKTLELANPLKDGMVIYPAYYIGNRRGKEE